MFVTFEGTEGSGKSTQIQLAADFLKKTGCDVVTTREPGGTPIADRIRQVLLDPESKEISPMAELLLYFASRAQHVSEVIQPALDAGKVVLCDRFFDSTLAYQGFGRGLNQENIHEMNRLATGGLSPDLTLCLDLPVEKGLGRAKARNKNHTPGEDRMEQEELAFHERVREGFLTIANSEPERFRLVDATGSVEEIHGRIVNILEVVLDKAKSK